MKMSFIRYKVTPRDMLWLTRGGATGGVWGGGTPPHSSANRQIIISVGKTVLAKDTH